MINLPRKAAPSRGFVCNRMGCCCFQTMMELLPNDIARLEKIGYSSKDFSYKDGATVRLLNVEEHCFFLEPTSKKCRIYRNRPLGCKIYPAILLNDTKVTVDRFCPNYKTLSKHARARKELLLKTFFT